VGSGKIVAGHAAWPAEIVPFGHFSEGEGDVVILGFTGVSYDPIPVSKERL
jgi:hypothetical protein